MPNRSLTYKILTCLLWVALVFYVLSHPPESPAPFHDQAQGALRAVYNPEIAAALDQDLRDFWQKPDQVLELLGNLTGLKIADIGCGEGYFTLRLLSLVGAQGEVFATDIQQEMLEILANKIPADLLDRVNLIQASTDDTGVPEPVDLILLIQVLGEIENQASFLGSLKRIMHHQTRLVVIDSKHVTDPVNGFTRPLNLHKLKKVFHGQGLVPHEGYNSLDLDFLPKQFFFVLRLAG